MPRLWTVKDIKAIVKNIISSLPGNTCLIYMVLELITFINEETVTIEVFSVPDRTFKTHNHAYNFVCNSSLTGTFWKRSRHIHVTT